MEVLQKQAADHSGHIAFRFLVDGEDQEETITYGQLDRRARSIAVRLRSICRKGDRVMLLLPPGLDFIAAYFGSLYAGCVAIPLYPHLRPKRDKILTRIFNVAKDATPAAILSNETIENVSAPLFLETEHARDIPWFDINRIPDHLSEQWTDPGLTPGDPAFFQYTSGSTSQPKGVVVSHGNLMHNALTIAHVFDCHTDDRAVTWLPPYHDMGLIGGILVPVFARVETVIIPPTYFLQRPMRWLKAISHYRATHSGGPNFAYDYAVKKIKPEQLAELDLSRWRVAFCGAEPINVNTLRKFEEYFAPCGFRYSAFQPCYGLAESTLMVTSIKVEETPVVKWFDKDALERHEIRPGSDPVRGRAFVGCGSTVDDMIVRIVNPETRLAANPGEIGEIWVSGSSVAQAYWSNPEATREIFQARIAGSNEGPFMRTGDLGFLFEGQLYITGRIKSLIIIDGSNHYPQDIEWTAEQSHPGIRPHGVAAFSIQTDAGEKLVIMAELDPRVLRDLNDEEARKIKRAILSAISAEHDLSVHDIVFVSSLPRTTSGKIAHHQCQAEYLETAIENNSNGQMRQYE